MTRAARIGLGTILGIMLLGLLFLVTHRPMPLASTTFGDVSLKVELATTTAARERGLGGRANVPENYGMLFVFESDKPYGFWMKDMQVPLDIFWLDRNGQVVSTALHVAPESYPHVFYPTVPARYVLETRAGFAEDHGIATGTPLDLKKLETVLR